MNYAELYGVKPNEINFSGAIKRWKDSGMKLKHLDNFVKELDGTNNYFSTFTENFGNEYSEERKKEVVKSLKTIAYKAESL